MDLPVNGYAEAHDRPVRPAEGRLSTVVALTAVIALGAGCASTSSNTTGGSDDVAEIGAIRDPLEPTNRVILNANEAVDRNALKPVAQAYVDYVPDPLRANIRAFVQTLSTPLIIINEALQGDWDDMQRASARLFLNVVLGFGINDVAGELDPENLAYESEDFGQTLAVWGVDPGPYLVLPFFGPSTTRDAFGQLVEFVANPVGFGLDAASVATEVGAADFVLDGVDTRARALGQLEEIQASSVDYYAALRSLYIQNRNSQILDGEVTPSFDIPDFDDAVFEDFDAPSDADGLDTSVETEEPAPPSAPPSAPETAPEPPAQAQPAPQRPQAPQPPRAAEPEPEEAPVPEDSDAISADEPPPASDEAPEDGAPLGLISTLPDDLVPEAAEPLVLDLTPIVD